MNGREMFQTMLYSFFVILSGTFISMIVFCLIINPSATFSLKELGVSLGAALACDSLYIVFYSKKELSSKQMFFRQCIHFVVLLAVLLFYANWAGWVNFNRPIEIIVFVGLVLGVYVVVLAVQVHQTKKLADKLSQRLKERYKG